MKKLDKLKKKGPKEEKPSTEAFPKPEKESLVKENHAAFRLMGMLCGLCAVCALLLGVTNLLTKERIAENQGTRNDGALVEVLPYGERYDKVNYTGGDRTVEVVYRSEGVGYVVQVSPEDSYSGTFTLMVGVNSDGTVAGVAVVNSGETESLGGRAKEPEFREQFIGKSGMVQVEAEGGDIAAISGATITSKAVCAAVNSALSAAAEQS